MPLIFAKPWILTSTHKHHIISIQYPPHKCLPEKSCLYCLRTLIMSLLFKDPIKDPLRSHFLDITWEPDFCQACSFCRMLMNHTNFHYIQIPDKTMYVILLKSSKTMFLGHFWPFLPDGDFFQKIRLCHTQLYMDP